MTHNDLAIRFFLQLAAILVVCRIVGAAAKFLRQPQVVGEMIAGVLLGPSLLGLVAPDVSAFLFPPASKPILYVVAQVGLALYMFTVGLEFRTEIIARKFRDATSISLSGILTPFALGGLIAWQTAGDGRFFSPDTSRWEAVLFMGAAMSITAFPMLARIIYERGLTGTVVGTLSLAAGSIDDAMAWCLLAVVLASFAGDPMIAVKAIGGGLGYALFVFLVLRPLLRPLDARTRAQGQLDSLSLVTVLLLLMLGAWFTDWVGIYAVFGAFMLGMAMPRGPVTEDLQRKIEPLTTHLLLPLFFIYSGLNTRITLVNTPALWLVALLILLAACVGKGLACYAAARWHGQSNRAAVAIGALMNARGLMELIILNIGLERGLITPTLFSIMVFMAIVTTLMATPVFEYAARGDRQSVFGPSEAAPRVPVSSFT